MNRTIMISDIHGCLVDLDQLLNTISFDSRVDQLFLLGDFVDRGPNSKETVERVMQLVQQHHAIALRGNHDQRLVDLIRNSNKDVRRKFLEHGGLQTIQSYLHSEVLELNDDVLDSATDYIGKNFMDHIRFLENLPLYYEDDSHIYVHAGLNPNYPNWREQPDYDFMYIKDEFIYSRMRFDKPVVFGHTRTSDIHGSPDVWFQEDRIGIDGGCAYGLQLNGLIYENGTYKTVKVGSR
ncbi:metallophosphoesterase family protein [Cohnella sp. AR92]|uniref:metallophosphoesterase family protein n=1 Tax=Cohnella sp. AR92 TaxID=648716 RepID=UPI000F8EC5E9|nr:metallophosphoesterase family protein [Cohnella sp. AR92]RUS45843.1 serine/threonine protein phosphatase [Cohnella sp. AR92]